MTDRKPEQAARGIAADEAFLRALSEKYRLALEDVRRIVAEASPQSREQAEALVMARGQQYTGNPHHGQPSDDLVPADEPLKVHGDKLQGV